MLNHQAFQVVRVAHQARPCSKKLLLVVTPSSHRHWTTAKNSSSKSKASRFTTKPALRPVAFHVLAVRSCFDIQCSRIWTGRRDWRRDSFQSTCCSHFSQ